MGLILDTCVLIAGERRGESVRSILRRAQNSYGESDIAISAVTVVELTHGIYRARTEAQQRRRRILAESVYEDIIVHPVSLQIAQLAGRIEGEQAAQGVSIAFEDLVIGCTALHLGFDVLTYNVKHFKLIPGLSILTL
jgi:tRNA(fMet)-specific endonuclease VapC